MLLTGIILIVTDTATFNIQLFLTMPGAMLTVLFIPCCFAEASRWLTINDYEIVLPRGAIINDKTVFSRTIIRIPEISSVESRLQEGYKRVSKDTYFHTIKLKDGKKIIFTLHAFGKKGEKEILETIKNSICVNRMINN